MILQIVLFGKKAGITTRAKRKGLLFHSRKIQEKQLFQMVQGKPSWIWNIEKHKRYTECSYQGRSEALEDQKVPPDVFHFL